MEKIKWIIDLMINKNCKKCKFEMLIPKNNNNYEKQN